jgi:hypothetical protein
MRHLLPFSRRQRLPRERESRDMPGDPAGKASALPRARMFDLRRQGPANAPPDGRSRLDPGPRGSKRQAGFIAPGEKKEGDGDFEFMLDDKAQRLERKNEMFSFALTSRVLCRTTQENPPVPGGDFPVFALLCLAHIALRVAIVIFRDRRTRKGGGPKMIKLNIPRAAPAPLQLRSPRPCRSARRALSRTSCGVIWPVKKLSPAATLFLRATSSSRCATARTTSRNVNAATRKLHARTRCVPRTSNYRQRISASQLPHVTAVGREGT